MQQILKTNGKPLFMIRNGNAERIFCALRATLYGVAGMIALIGGASFVLYSWLPGSGIMPAEAPCQVAERDMSV